MPWPTRYGRVTSHSVFSGRPVFGGNRFGQSKKVFLRRMGRRLFPIPGQTAGHSVFSGTRPQAGRLVARDKDVPTDGRLSCSVGDDVRHGGLHFPDQVGRCDFDLQAAYTGTDVDFVEGFHRVMKVGGEWLFHADG